MRRVLLVFALAALPAPARAQSSQFGIRGLGLPGREVSVRALGMGGSVGAFDPGSSLSPVPIAFADTLAASFLLLQNYRNSTNPAGTVAGRDTRFPLFTVSGVIPGSAIHLGLSISSLTDRDFALATSDTVVLRGTPVAVADTLTSTGGLADLRLGAGYRHGRWAVGGAVHLVTGSNRTSLRRVFSDTAYEALFQRAELSYTAPGLSAGVLYALTPALSITAFGRLNAAARTDRDSTRIATIALPFTVGAGARWTGGRLTLAAQTVYRTWSRADSTLTALGGAGALNALDLSAGGEYARDRRRPTRFPIRLGVRYAALPFPIIPGERPREYGVSVGTGVRFSGQRGGLDFSLERVWRKAGTAYHEGAWLAGLGVTVRP